MSDSYRPLVNDYVTWKERIEGWVYFTCPDYITIELYVKDKPDQLVGFHKKTHVLLLCYAHQWHELTFIKHRESIYEVSGEVSPGTQSEEGSILQD